MNSNQHETREQWLNAAMQSMVPWLAEQQMVVPPRVRASVGFAKYGAPKAIGQCWNPSTTADETTHLFICPSLGDTSIVLSTLLHEMVHAAVGTEAGHRGLFLKGVRSLGLKGKATVTYLEENSPLHAKVIALADELGPYPHSPMTVRGKIRPPGGGWLKLISIKDEDYIIRISPKAFKENGAPTDPWGNSMVEAE